MLAIGIKSDEINQMKWMKEMKPKIIIWIWVFLKLSSQFFFNVFFCLETIELGMQNYFLKRSLTCSWEQILLTFNIDTHLMNMELILPRIFSNLLYSYTKF